MNKTAQIILNLIVGLVSFLLFVILLFPLDSMISHFLADIESQTKGNGDWRISVSNIDASLIFDTEFEDFRVYQKDKEVFYAPKVSAGISLLPLISGSVNLRFDAEYRKGTMSGRVSLADESVVDLTVDKLSIKELGFATSYLDQNNYPKLTSGEITGAIYFAWTKDSRNKECDIELKIRKAKTSPVAIKAANMEVPAMILSSKKQAIEINIELEKGQLLINKFNIPGPDMKFSLSGRSRLNRNNSLIRIKTEGQFSFSEMVKKKVPFIAMLDSQANSDGSYPITIEGSAKSPQINIGSLELSKMLNL